MCLLLCPELWETDVKYLISLTFQNLPVGDERCAPRDRTRMTQARREVLFSELTLGLKVGSA